MKNNRMKSLSGLVGISALAVLGLVIKDKYDEYQKEKMTADLRQFFAEMGEIAVVYFDQTASEKGSHSGGVVLSDGREYSFTYRKGDIVYQEEQAHD